MAHLSSEAKAAIVKKALDAQGVIDLKLLAKQNNIGLSTLQRWIAEYRTDTVKQPAHNGKQKLSRVDRLNHLFATASLDEQALGTYCRERGLYAVELTKWKDEFMTDNYEQKQVALSTELKVLRAEANELRKELDRKDRALAEMAALMVLKKKASTLWGDREVG